MYLVPGRGVPQDERLDSSIGGLTDWDSARVFLETARSNFDSIADRLQRSIDVARRRINDSARQNDATLFALNILGIGPTEQRVLAREKYNDIFGAPKSTKEPLQRPHLDQKTEMAIARKTYEGRFPAQSQQNRVVVKTSVGRTNDRAIISTDGTRVPTRADGRGRKIVPLSTERQNHFDIWLSYHPGSGGFPRVRQMLDWLVETFNSTRFPWFKDGLLNPTELKSVYKGESPTQLFGGFSTRTVKAE
jgi:DNA-binding transcriptional LysR family regulator